MGCSIRACLSGSTFDVNVIHILYSPLSMTASEPAHHWGTTHILFRA